VIALYANGMTTRDICDYLRKIYGDKVSPTLVSNVTNQVMDDLNEWKTRALNDAYAVVFIDAIILISKSSFKFKNTSIYCIWHRL
jgi:transposase-like protein